MNKEDVAVVILVACIASGAVQCAYVPDAHVTQYAPELGGTNCMEPCDRTAFMVPIDYGVTAACGPDIPYNTVVYIETENGVIERRCQDRGGAIDNDEVDIAVRPHELVWWSARVPVVWASESVKRTYGVMIE